MRDPFYPVRRLAVAMSTLMAVISFAAVVPAANAEVPVNQCPGPGSAPTTAGGEYTTYTPRGPNVATVTPISTAYDLGTVNLKTGAYSFSNEDLVLGGEGGFPARLSLIRTFSSDQYGGDEGFNGPWFAPYMAGQPTWRPFGLESTHNLDIAFEITWQTYSGHRYQVVHIHLGFDTVSFQRCDDGSYINTRRDGSRLVRDTTYSTNGLRYDMRDGTRLLFQALSDGSRRYCYYGQFACGVLRRWIAPNGDWAQFDYEEYYSTVSNTARVAAGKRVIVPNNPSVTECHVNRVGVNDCRQVVYPFYYVYHGDAVGPNFPGVTGNHPIYAWRLTRVSNSRGFDLRFAYIDQTVDEGGPCILVVTSVGGPSLSCSPPKNFYLERNRIASVSGFWTPAGGSPTLLQQVSYRYVENSQYLTEFHAADESVTRYTRPGTALSIYLPGSTTPATTVTFAQVRAGYYVPEPRVESESGQVAPGKRNRYYYRVAIQSFADGRVVQYNPTFAGKWVEEHYGTWDWATYISRMEVVEPGNVRTVYDFEGPSDEHASPTAISDPLGRVTANVYNPVGAPVSTTLPGGQQTEYAYDVRGNVTRMTRRPGAGSALAPLVEATTYVGGPALDANACASMLTCNRPTSRIDARGFRTDFAWNASGLLVSETRPAAPDGQRPTITYGYQGFPGATGSTIQLLTSLTERIEATQNVTTTYGYDASVARQPREMVRDSGELNLRTCFDYDTIGNLVSATTPRSGLPSCP